VTVSTRKLTSKATETNFIEAGMTTDIDPSRGFAPVIGQGAKVLILGSLPGRVSLRAGQYYANPGNSFWRIMGDIVGLSSSDDYTDRCISLINKSISLWDVLESAVRPGSLDSAIDTASAKANDFEQLFARFPGIVLICFNGKKAQDLFQRRVVKTTSLPAKCEQLTLPSSSPAHASMNFEQKLEQWSIIGRYLAPVDQPIN
jgi:hypoxanthine-DNA glycosylase